MTVTTAALEDIVSDRAAGLTWREMQNKHNVAERNLRRRFYAYLRTQQPIMAAVPEGFEVTRLSTTTDKDGKTKLQSTQAKPISTDDSQLVPAGHLVKGYSTLTNAQGEITARWTKTRLDEQKWLEMVKGACDAAAAGIKPLPRVDRAIGSTLPMLANLYTITDFHIGMLAWGRETGAPWDLEIAERVLVDVLYQMIDSAPAAEVGILNQLGDFLHFDSLKSITPEHGHLLDADGRYQKVVEVAVSVLRRVITKLLEKHARVQVFMHEGNHDPAGSVWLRVMFAQLYSDNPRVTIEKSPLPYVVYQHGETLLAFHHGHLAKKESLPLLFAAKFPVEWGTTKKRYTHVGHMHHSDEKEHPGMKVIQHPTLAAPDAYAARGGWLSERQAMFITYHKTRGEIARGTFVPEE